MMMPDIGESTPLMATRGNGEWQPANNNNNHRQNGNDNHHHHNNNMSRRRHNGFEEHNGFLNSTTTLGEGGGGGYNTNSNNKDRRSYWSQLRDTLFRNLPIIRGQVRAGTANCNADNSDCGSSFPEHSFYEDTYNDESWSCTFGTHEEDGIWLNVHDRVGTVMSSLVWILILYSGVTVGLLSQHNHLSPTLAKIYFTLCALALASHAKTTFTDPGAIPQSAVPVDVYTPQAHAMCSRCQSYKPKGTHHCRICDRCISGMDHHCPWMNNCVGTGNMKFFVLFLCYTWTACSFALIMFGYNYFFCADEECTFSPVLIQLVRAMTLLCIGTLVFTSSMLTNVTFGVMTGVGTIDRLKMKADNTWGLADDEPLELKDIFGVGDKWTWALPFFDPVFEDYDLAMGYSTPQRLLRERA